MDDLLQDLKATLYDRMSTPLFGALLLAWCYWNIELLLIVIWGDTSMQTRLTEIKKNPALLDHWRLYWWPLLSALAAIVVYPLSSLIVFLWGRGVAILKQKAHQYIEEHEVRPVADFHKLEEGYREKVSKGSIEIARLEERLATLVAARESERAKNEEATSHYTTQIEGLKNGEGLLNAKIKKITEELEVEKARSASQRETLKSKAEEIKLLNDKYLNSNRVAHEILERYKRIKNDKNILTGKTEINFIENEENSGNKSYKLSEVSTPNSIKDFHKSSFGLADYYNRTPLESLDHLAEKNTIAEQLRAALSIPGVETNSALEKANAIRSGIPSIDLTDKIKSLNPLNNK